MIAAIIQARVSSSRLPRKVLADIAGKSMIQRVIERVKGASLLDCVILATSDRPEDAPLARIARRLNVGVYLGSLDDVLDRYYQASNCFGVKTIVRITADCPLLDPAIIDRVLTVFLEGGFDYASTSYPVSTFPDGLDVEVCTKEALAKAWKDSSLLSEREHVTPYIWKNPHEFRLTGVVNPEDLSGMRWSVDEERDLQFIRKVYYYLEDESGRIFGMNEILTILDQHSELLEINQGIPNNEGYWRSLKKDREVEFH